MQEESKPAVDRRGLLRRAGTVAAAAGVVSAAGAVAAAPAVATPGQTLTHAGTFVGPAGQTSIEGGTQTSPTLRLGNHETIGMPLELRPITFPGGNSPIPPSVIEASPTGSVFVDDFGDMHVVGEGQFPGGPVFHYDNMMYSPTWATMTIPVPPTRIVHTWPGHPGGRDLIVDGSATYETGGAGRVVPRAEIAPGVFGPDLVIDLSDFVLGGFAALQCNLTIGDAAGAGWAAMWPTLIDDEDPDVWPGNSSINFQTTQYIANFTQTIIGDLGRISIRVTRPVTLIIDVCGFVVTDQLAQLNPAIFGSAFGSNSAAAGAGVAGFSASSGRRRGVPFRG